MTRLLIILFLSFVLSACGLGRQGPSVDGTIINAAELSDTGRFNLLAQDLGKQPISFEVRENTAYMNGILDSSIPVLLQNLLNNYPEVDTIVMEKINGSIDLNATYEAGRILREACLTTVVPYEGFIASGGVSFFLAGCERIVETDGKVGIHTWRSFTLNEAGEKEVTIAAYELPVDDDAHTPHLDYILEMDIPEDFYWRTVETPFDDVHYLTPEELDAYGIVTQSQADWGAAYNAQYEKTQVLDWAQSRFYVRDGVVTMHGQIDATADDKLNEVLDLHSGLHTLEFGVVHGNTTIHSDHAKDLGRVIRAFCLNTRLSSSSDVRGEAIHAYIAGCSREMATDTYVGLASSFDHSGGQQSRTPYFYQTFVSSYIQYYEEMSIDPGFFSYQLSIPRYDPRFVDRTELERFGIF